jgi:hypothetical protein
MTARRSWIRPWIAGLFGLLGGVYFTYTGETLSWRLEALGGDPFLPVSLLFEIHPLLGIAFFAVGAFGAVRIGQYLEHRYASSAE